MYVIISKVSNRSENSNQLEYYKFQVENMLKAGGKYTNEIREDKIHLLQISDLMDFCASWKVHYLCPSRVN